MKPVDGTADQHWPRIRQIFESLCDLPADSWEARLDSLGTDDGIRREVQALLQSQTRNMSRVRTRLDEAFAQALAPEIEAGQQLGPWLLTEHIASGGMGKVFRAERNDGLYQRTVAIKLLHGWVGKGESQQLRYERQVLADLQLPNVARLYDGGSTPSGHPYLVMEYIDGRSLDRYCAEEQLTLAARLQLFLSICRSVQSAHERLVLHCDLKPGNVRVTASGQPVLLDFGVARMLSDMHLPAQAGFCTPGYASPELVRGETIGVASDVYSLGVMLVELLADSALPATSVQEEPGKPVPVPSMLAAPSLEWVRLLQGDLDAICAKACAPDTAERYSSVQMLIADIERYLQREPVMARAGGRWYILEKMAKRHWRALAVASGVGVLACVFVIGLMQARQRAEEEAAVARQVSNFLVGAFETTDPNKRSVDDSTEVTARQLLDNATKRVASDLEGAPVQLARMRAVLGLAYQNLGIPAKAELLLQEAAEGLMDPRAARPLDAAKVLADYSIQKSRFADGAQGVHLADQGLALLGNERAGATRAHLYNARGVALTVLQDFPAAEQDFLRAIALMADEGVQAGSDAQKKLHYNMGMLYWRWGRLEQAERQFQAVLLGLQARNISLAHEVQTRLAQILRQQGRFTEALPLLRQSMTNAVRLYGTQNTFVLLQHDALCDLYQQSGNYEAAEVQYRERQKLSEALHGRDSFDYSMGVFNYASLQEMRGDITRAEQLYRQAWEIRRDLFGMQSPITARAGVGLALALLQLGRAEEARQHIDHGWRLMAEKLPVDAPARVEADLARIELALHQQELELAASLLDSQVVPSEVMPLYSYLGLHALHAEQRGELDQALEWRGKALMTILEAYGPDNPLSARQRLEIARLHHRQGNTSQMRAQVMQAAPILRQALVPNAPALQQLDALLETR